MKGVVSGWGAMVCANVWLADGNAFIGLAFLALAIAIASFLIKESGHD